LAHCRQRHREMYWAMSNKLLTESQQRCYEQQGLLFPLEVLSPASARRYRAACDDLEQQLGGKPKTVQVRQMHLHFRWAWDLALEPRVLDAVEDLLGPNILVWATELFAKHPHDKAISIGWHRDQPYLGFDCRHATTAWIALEDSTIENGCMQAVLESDRRRAASEKKSTREPPPESEFVNVNLRAGQMSLHDGDLLHGSGSNQSPNKRVGFVVRYVSPEAVPLSKLVPAVLARGSDPYGRFPLACAPEETTSAEALAGLQKSASDHLDSMLVNLKRA
jgi:non-heme Fe2+,alpha-ketoglutarate-dependent halogenase